MNIATTFLLSLSILLGPAAGSRTTPVATGAAAPNFTLEAHTGERVALSERLANGPVVLVFYRGAWCPFCVKQLSELRSLAKPAEAVSVLAISVDGTATNRKLAAKLEEKGPSGILLLSDPDHATIDAFGLHDPAYDGGENDGIPRASVYVVGRDGKVAWSQVSEDYKKRPSNAEIRAALDAL